MIVSNGNNSFVKKFFKKFEHKGRREIERYKEGSLAGLTGLGIFVVIECFRSIGKIVVRRIELKI